MFVRTLAALAVFAVPALALACPGAKAAGASAAECPHAAKAAKSGEECPFAKAEGSCDAAACAHAKVGTVTASAGQGAACGAHEAKPGQVTVTELASQLKASPAAIPVDANNEKTRAKDGVIPGAKLLTSASAYDPAKEIGAPKDAHLVFYCANTRCTASHTAAKRAMEAGYTNVSILPEGIAGWKAAGQATTAVPRS
jgi:rhodanese-related sulfurtransferase